MQELSASPMGQLDWVGCVQHHQLGPLYDVCHDAAALRAVLETSTGQSSACTHSFSHCVRTVQSACDWCCTVGEPASCNRLSLLQLACSFSLQQRLHAHLLCQVSRARAAMSYAMGWGVLFSIFFCLHPVISLLQNKLACAMLVF